MLGSLDPKRENTSVYSRYAIVRFRPATGSAPAPEFELDQTTVYTVKLPLTDRWLRPAGIDGIVVVNSPDLAVPQPYREVASISDCRFWIREPADEAAVPR
jgi:hypothetical protein